MRSVSMPVCSTSRSAADARSTSQRPEKPVNAINWRKLRAQRLAETNRNRNASDDSSNSNDNRRRRKPQGDRYVAEDEDVGEMLRRSQFDEAAAKLREMSLPELEEKLAPEGVEDVDDDADFKAPTFKKDGNVNWDKKYKVGDAVYVAKPLYGPDAPKQSPELSEDEVRAKAKGEKPAWVKDMQDWAQTDDVYKEVLEGTDGDPDLIRAKMQKSQESKFFEILRHGLTGSSIPMTVKFRDYNHDNLWVWLELHQQPTPDEVSMIEVILKSWFTIGRLGGYNGMNLQLLYTADYSYMEYNDEELAGTLSSYMHDMSVLEQRGLWCRFWLDMGTADELGLDILINALYTFSKETLGIKSLIIGGENPDWRVPTKVTKEDFQDEDMDMPPGFINQAAHDFTIIPNESVVGKDGIL